MCHATKSRCSVYSQGGYTHILTIRERAAKHAGSWFSSGRFGLEQGVYSFVFGLILIGLMFSGRISAVQL